MGKFIETGEWGGSAEWFKGTGQWGGSGKMNRAYQREVTIGEDQWGQ